MDYFDYETVAREARIPSHQLARIVAIMEQEFPHDQMMCELHILRTCMAIRDGHISLDRALAADLTAGR